MTGLAKITIGLTVLAVLIPAVTLVYQLLNQHRKSIPKRLTIYNYGSSLLLSIDPSIASSLKAIFEDKPVGSVFGLRYLIENTGIKAIKDTDCREPLSLTTGRPSAGGKSVQDKLIRKWGLLHASVIYSQPESAVVLVESVLLTQELTKTTFKFPLLNEGDLFIIQLLFDEYVNPDVKFNIRGEDLRQSTITPVDEPFLLNTISKPGRLAWWVVALVLGIVAVLAIGYFLFLSPSSLLGKRSWWPYALMAIPLGLTLVSLVGMLIHLFRVSEMKRRQSPVPDEFRWK
jgi:hypothetical protein